MTDPELDRQEKQADRWTVAVCGTLIVIAVVFVVLALGHWVI